MASLTLISHSPIAVWINLEGAIDRLVRCVEISLHRIVESEILQRPRVLWIQTGRLLEICSGLSPFSLAALDCADGEINFRFVRQSALCDFKFF